MKNQRLIERSIRKPPTPSSNRHGERETPRPSKKELEEYTLEDEERPVSLIPA